MKVNKATNHLSIGLAISLVIAAVFGGMYLPVYKGPEEVASATAGGAIKVANEGYNLFKRAGIWFWGEGR